MSQHEIKIILDALKELDSKVNEHIQTSDRHWLETLEHMRDTKFSLEEMRPIIEALRFIQTFQKFLKWGGLTFAAFVGMIYWFIKRS